MLYTLYSAERCEIVNKVYAMFFFSLAAAAEGGRKNYAYNVVVYQPASKSSLWFSSCNTHKVSSILLNQGGDVKWGYNKLSKKKAGICQ